VKNGGKGMFASFLSVDWRGSTSLAVELGSMQRNIPAEIVIFASSVAMHAVIHAATTMPGPGYVRFGS